MAGYQRRQRTTFSRDQLAHLQRVFKANHYPDAEVRSRLAHITKLDPARIQVWFQNQRAKDRKRQDVRSPSPTPPPPQSFQSLQNLQNLQNEAHLQQQTLDEARSKQSPLPSYVYVFTSATANEAAEAISEGRFKSLAEFHRDKHGWPAASCQFHHHNYHSHDHQHHHQHEPIRTLNSK